MGITKNINKEMYVKMKSRKLRAVLAALSAIAVLATAMTGFAATVTTTTKYLTNADYVHVTSVVTGANGQVTYLAKTTEGNGVNSTGIIYIDQAEATGDSITFDYMVDKSVIDGITTEVALGTDGTEDITNADPTIGLYATPADVVTAEYTIAYDSDYYGNGDDFVTAVITPAAGLELEEVTIGGEEADLSGTYEVPVNGDGTLPSIAVTTKLSEVTPSVNKEITTVTELGDGKYEAVTILSVVGNPEEVGVTYGEWEFPALGAVNEGGYVAVTIIDAVEIDESSISSYNK